MRQASFTRFASLAAASMLLAASAIAAPTITEWRVETDGTKQVVDLRWSEAATVQLMPSPTHREFIAVFEGTSLRPGMTSRLEETPLVERARLNEVTLPSGAKGVQLTLRLSQWVPNSVESTADGYRIVFDAPDMMSSNAPEVVKAGLEFSDAKLAEFEASMGSSFGSYDAPSTGAGQSGGDISGYYVPPNVDRNAASSGNATLDDVGVQTKLDEFVRRVDFQGTSLENVLRLISEEAELNIVITPALVSGRQVTLRLRNVTLRQMLDVILKANELGYAIEPGGIIRIVPRDQVKGTVKETATETIAINWVDATEVGAALQPFIDVDDGAIRVLASNNVIIVRDVPETIQDIQKLVQLLDVPEKQVLIEMRLINMTENARRAFGVRTTAESQSTENIFVRDPNANFFDNSAFTNATGNNTSSLTNTRTLSTTNDSGFTATNPGAVSSTSDQTLEDGTDITSTISNTLTSAFGVVPSSRTSAGLLAPNASALQFVNHFTPTIFGTEFDVEFALNAQEDRGEAVTLANPTVLSLNNQEANVEIKRQLPYVSAVNSDQGSVATIEFIDIGTNVTILPRITNNGYIQMDINPEQIIDTGVRANGVPVTDERSVTSSVIVRDEQTVALGGLREFSSSSSESGVPYLLRLPVLSWLFKNQTNTQNKTELYLFVKPQIVKDPTPTAHQTALYEKIDYNWDLPDYFFDEVTARLAPGEEKNPYIKN